MANVKWTGRSQDQAQVDTLTVTAVAVGGTLTATINGANVTYTCVTGDTTTTAAAAWYALLSASTAPPEFRELTYANDATNSPTVISITGPADGKPFTLTKSQAGGATCTLVNSATAPISSHDVANTTNWSSGSLPGNGDTAIFEDSSVSALYNLSQFNANTVNVIRRATYTGTIGLPDTSVNGYMEYRTKAFQTVGLTHRIECGPSDSAGQIRLQCMSASASTITINGSTQGQVGSEVVHLWGLASTSVVNVANASVAISTDTAKTSTIATVNGANASITIGPGTTLTTLALVNCQASVQVGLTTLTQDGGGTVTVLNAAAITNITTDGGTIAWESTGNPGVIILGSGGIFDLSGAPSSVTPTSLEMLEGSTLINPAKRLAVGYAIDVTRCGIADISLDLGTHFKITVAAHT